MNNRERVFKVNVLGRERLFVALFAIVALFASIDSATSQTRTVIRGGQIVTESTADITEAVAEDIAEPIIDSIEKDNLMRPTEPMKIVEPKVKERDKDKHKFFSDSMSISAMCWKAAAIPGYGQIYNRQYWKLPLLYGTVGGGLAMFIRENQRYKPLKAQYDELSISLDRTDELNSVQAAMIRSNTRRQLWLGATAASFVYFLADAALNYSTNDVSDIKKATTLAMICPGAGQIYNGSYWKFPIVVGGFATLVYVVDWNNRGYKRFQTAYRLTYAYENGEYEEAVDEFSGQYSATYLKSIRQSYRRARDLSIIMLAGLYILQVVDAHVDAHFKDFDISDNLSLSVEPTINTVYSPRAGQHTPTYGLNVGAKF